MRGVIVFLSLFLAVGVAVSEDRPKPRLFVVAIAIDEYPKEFAFAPIKRKTALAEASKRLVDKLAKKQEKGVFRDAHVHLLQGAKATGEAIAVALEEVIENASPEDVFVFYFGGAIRGTYAETDASEAEVTLREELDALGREYEAIEKEAQPDVDALAELEMEGEKIAGALEVLEEQKELIVRFLQHGVDAGDPDSAIPHFWLAEAFAAVPCASQLVVIDGDFEERVIRRSNVLNLLLNEPREELRDHVDVRRMLIYPGTYASDFYPATRTLVTECLLECLDSDGDLDKTGVVSAAEVRAKLPAVAYRLLAESRVVASDSDTSGLEPRSISIGHNFPLRAVSAVKHDAESTRGVGVRRGKKTTKKKADPKRPRQDRALLIAINDYEHWKDLANPVFDATRLRDVLQADYGFKVDLLKDPTCDELVAAILKLQKISYGPHDQLLIFFAGHGHYTAKLGTGYIIPKDATKPKFDAVRPKPKNAVAHHVLSHIVNSIDCRHTFLVLDSCFSGTFKKKAADGGMRGGANYGERKGDELIRHRLRNKGRFYLTSGGKEYVEDGDRGKHSPFARVLIGELVDAATDNKIVDCWAIAARVSAIKASTPTAGKFGDTDPGRPEFLFVPKSK